MNKASVYARDGLDGLASPASSKSNPHILWKRSEVPVTFLSSRREVDVELELLTTPFNPLCPAAPPSPASPGMTLSLQLPSNNLLGRIFAFRKMLWHSTMRPNLPSNDKLHMAFQTGPGSSPNHLALITDHPLPAP